MQVTSVTSSEMQQRGKIPAFTFLSCSIICVPLSSLQPLTAEQHVKNDNLWCLPLPSQIRPRNMKLVLPLLSLEVWWGSFIQPQSKLASSGKLLAAARPSSKASSASAETATANSSQLGFAASVIPATNSLHNDVFCHRFAKRVLTAI